MASVLLNKWTAGTDAIFHAFCGAGMTDCLGTLFGNRKPVAISQTKPGNLVSGMRKRVFGNTRFSQLSSPQSASTRPNTHSHFGSSFMIAAGTHTPAIKRPSGTEKPGPPRPYDR